MSYSYAPYIDMIRKRARSMEIGDCWEVLSASGLNVYLVTRKHKLEGMLTACFYLVDIQCLGVKNVIVIPLISEEDLLDKMAGMSKGNERKMDYIDIHNWIYGAIEYAKELGIEPCAEFTDVARYILCDDEDETIPIKNFEYGHEGKPLFVPHTREEFNKYFPVLLKRLGKDNFDYIAPVDYFDNEKQADSL